MNWDRGLKRVTLVLSFIGAIVSAVIAADIYLQNLAMAVGAVLGFGFIWAIYAGTKWGAWPMFLWIIAGFRENKKKDT